MSVRLVFVFKEDKNELSHTMKLHDCFEKNMMVVGGNTVIIRTYKFSVCV